MDGQGVAAWHCPTLWAAAVRLVELSNTDDDLREVAPLALELRRAHPDDLTFAASVVQLVQTVVPYVQDPVGWIHGINAELFRSPGSILQAPRRGGDCDDHARLVKALARAGGLPASLWFLGTVEEPSHVVARVGVGALELWAETTLAAYLGEHPVVALRRLGKGVRNAL